jgi:AraC-like DNA-binding protein
LPLYVLRLAPDGQIGVLPLNPSAADPPAELVASDGAARRSRHLRELAQQAALLDRFSVAQFRGFADFVCPLTASGASGASGQRLFLHGAHFVLEALDYGSILSMWRERSGLTTSGSEPAFIRFLNMALQRPVFDPNAMERLRRCCADLGRALRDGDEELLEHGFASAVPAPGLVLALRVLAPPAPETHPLKLRVELYRAEQACRSLLDEGDFGAESIHGGLVLRLKRAPDQARLAALVRELGTSLQRRFGMRVAVGAARAQRRDEDLVELATAALQRALREGCDLAIAGEAARPSNAPPYSELTRALDRLTETFERVALGDGMSAADEFVRTLTAWANGRSGVMRDQLLVATAQVAKAVARRNVLSPEVADHFIDDASQRLDRAGGAPHLIEEFKQALLRLALFTTDGPSGLHCMRLDKTLEYLKEHCAESLRLPRVARRAGFSVPTFSRAFKRATGTSFARYLRGLRVARAEELLKTTHLSGERIAELCGFRNQHHLIRSFKQVRGLTPGAYRLEVIKPE